MLHELGHKTLEKIGEHCVELRVDCGNDFLAEVLDDGARALVARGVDGATQKGDLLLQDVALEFACLQFTTQQEQFVECEAFGEIGLVS